MKELELKYGCNPNQKPAKIFMNDNKDLPVTVLSGPRLYQLLRRIKRLAAGKRIKRSNRTSGSNFF